MKPVLSLFVILLLWSCKDQKLVSSNGKKHQEEMNENKIVVAELFTSQGCSSCPPADKILEDFTAKNPNFILLSFHIDYWDYLGWKDTFGKKDFSERQNQYVTKFDINGAYTPQLVINGKTQFVVSNQYQLKIATTNKELAIDNNAKISINALTKKGNQIRCKYSIDNTSTEDKYLNVALISSSETTNVAAGENEGETLTSHNIVKYFKILVPKKSDEIIFENVETKVDKIVLYTQNERLEITNCTYKIIN
jgi:hypothetical protein